VPSRDGRLRDDGLIWHVILLGTLGLAFWSAVIGALVALL
jgi:hypothetical protein